MEQRVSDPLANPQAKQPSALRSQAKTVAFVVMVLVLVLRPQGLLGKKLRTV